MGVKKTAWSFALCFLTAFSCGAKGFPAGSQLIEAESMEFSPAGWEMKPSGKTLWFSGKAYIRSKPGKQLSAVKTCRVTRAGDYKIWIRHCRHPRRPNGTPFRLEVLQGVESQVFPFLDPTKREELTMSMIWSEAEVHLEEGDFEIRLTAGTPGVQRNPDKIVDCLLLTDDLDFKPDDGCFSPVYMQFVNPPDSDKALKFVFMLRRSDLSYYHQYRTLVLPSAKKALKPGEASAWIDLGPYLILSESSNANKLLVTAFSEKRGDNPSPTLYEVRFSRTPSDEKLLLSYTRRGEGSSAAFRIMLNENCKIQSGLECSKENLERAKQAKAKGKAPERFSVSANAYPGGLSAETVANELEVLRLLGVNTISGSRQAANTGFFVTVPLPNLNSPERRCPSRFKIESWRASAEKSEETARKLEEAGSKVIRFACLSDEPEFRYQQHLAECPDCGAAFAAFLARENAPADLLLKENPDFGTIEKARPAFDPAKPVLFYWSSRYGTSVMTEFYRTATETAKKLNPKWETTVNFAGGVRSSIAGDGLNWFELFRTHALEFGLHEDYGAWMKTFQIRSYYAAMLRAACRKAGVPYAPLSCFPGNTEWEFKASAAAQLGQGISCFIYYHYGPHYLPYSSPGSNSLNDWVHRAAKTASFAAGSIEDVLTEGAPVQGDAALLVSETSDLWNAPPDGERGSFSNLFGMERTFLYLLLRHLQVRPDLLSERDLAEDLPKYRVLFATDTHIRREHAPAIRKWVEDGGILFLDAGALEKDEYNAPLGLTEAWGIGRTIRAEDPRGMNPGRPPYELRSRKALDTVSVKDSFDALFRTWDISGGETLFIFSDGKSALIRQQAGKGAVFVSAALPAMEYIKKAVIVKAKDRRTEPPPADADEYEVEEDEMQDMYSATVYPEGPREFLRAVLDKADIRPSAAMSDPMLQCDLLQNGKDLVALVSNWSGKKTAAKLKLHIPGAEIVSAEALYTALETVRDQDGSTILSGTFGPCEIIRLKLK